MRGDNSYSKTAFKYGITNLFVFIIAIAAIDIHLVFSVLIFVGGGLSCFGLFYSIKGIKEKGGFGKSFAFFLNFLFSIFFLFVILGYFVKMH
jgi:hypothetical protein